MTSKRLKRRVVKLAAYAVLFCFTSLSGAQPLYAAPANTQLPDGFNNIVGDGSYSVVGSVGTVTQTGQTAVNQWGSFSIGADASVNFNGPDGFNSVNLVNGGAVSEIYGQLTAIGGSIFIANPAGVQIGNSAQINVGSLYVTNKELSGIADSIGSASGTEAIRDYIQGVTQRGAGELMSLGAIVNATNVTFDGSRIVLDTDRFYATDETTGGVVQDTDFARKLNIITSDVSNVVLGHTAYDEDNKTYNGQSKNFTVGNGNGGTTVYTGYMWVENAEQLQKMNTNLTAYYALRNSIDATGTSDNPFNSIGTSVAAFSGRFDGLGYSIFGLTIDNGTNANTGLFGYTNNATIRNFTLNGGSIRGGQGTGSAVGSATGGVIENITNTANVSGSSRVGGIVGSATGVTMSGLVNTGTISGTNINVGGIVGFMLNSSLSGETYNMGAVTGSADAIYVGGIAGFATNSTIGDDAFQIYNLLNVTGVYNVGGIVGGLSGGSVTTNVANYGNVTATGSVGETYQYRTGAITVSGQTVSNGVASVSVAVANAGGIVGSASDATISNAYNEGDVTTATGTACQNGTEYEYYIAGNVGGIVGRATNTTVTNAENKENTVAGAHNVGGIVGSLVASGEQGTALVSNSTNNGGEITATGARLANGGGFAYERVRPYTTSNDEKYIIGNIGGVVGGMYDGTTYSDGDTTAHIQVQNSSNRGTVHSAYINDQANVLDISKAANAGGIVGKLDTSLKGTGDLLEAIADDQSKAFVSGSKNMGDVQGYTGVGGVVGSMFNGSVANSFNVGTVNTTRTAIAGAVDPLNMGGVVGDTTVGAGAMAIIYNVYNSGQVGDETFTYYGRHVGGVVGRLTGYLSNSYNTGEIYNGFSTVGGVVGYWTAGDITNVFNTGSVTVVNNDTQVGTSQVGGIVGAYGDGSGGDTLSYAYNLGTIRSFAPYSANNHSVGGIIGSVRQSGLDIKNAYTTNNIYAATQGASGGNYNKVNNNSGVGQIVGAYANDSFQGDTRITNAYFVKMYDDSTFSATGNVNGAANKVVDSGFDKEGSYSYTDGSGIDHSLFDNGWRIYGSTTPILNAFTPELSGVLGTDSTTWGTLGIENVQYGTAFNPLLTIINLAEGNDNLTIDWASTGINTPSITSGIAVYGGGLTIENVKSDIEFWGTIYADGALTINAESDIHAGASANIYGSSVKIESDGNLHIHGTITSTDGDVSIESTEGDAEIIGVINSSTQDGTTTVAGVGKEFDSTKTDFTNIGDYTTAVSSVADAYGITTDNANKDGDISISAAGSAEVLYGNLGTGEINAGGSLNVTGGESVYVDSDLHIGGDLTMVSDGEIVLDLTNMALKHEAEDELYKFYENFLGHFGNGTNKISVSNSIGEAADFLITGDVWDYENGEFNLGRFNTSHDGNSYNLLDSLRGLTIVNGGKTVAAINALHIWVKNAEQLAGIAKAAETNSDFLAYSYALYGNIDASGLKSYTSIGGSTNAFIGTFDGRGSAIVGMQAENVSGIFGNVGTGTYDPDGTHVDMTGTVKDLGIYSSTFTGENAGAVAAVNSGTITNITTLGNTITATSNAGGIVGDNSGTIANVSASDTVIADGSDAYAGGIAGTNSGTIGEDGTQIITDSAVTTTGNAAAIGGIAGNNEGGGKIIVAESLGVTNGTGIDNVGGIAGVNSGSMNSVYNESIVTGSSTVGGVVGDNKGEIENAVNATTITATGDYAGGIAGKNSGTISSGRNAGEINGTNYVGGMAGENSGTLQDLSNALVASIHGNQYVGGVAGTNAGEISGENALVNEGAIYGNKYVGGIAGENQVGGVIANVDNDLVLNATGDGSQYFGGIAGTNSGTITDATNRSNVTANASIVGGIAGQNTDTGTLTGTISNHGDVSGSSGVAGVIGENSNRNLLNNSDHNDRITIENSGAVTASNGGAAGIIYHNNNNNTVNNVKLINTGTITGGGEGRGDNSATGGIFGKNSGNIGNSELINEGTVKGAGTTGGLIGENTGDVSGSSLINTVGATVTGGENTGGLIGKNSGTITGGHDGTMYADKIYNNGTVSGSSNVGGLIGNNDAGGKLTAGYNTGTVTGTGDNVGGVAGTNAGAIDQVFNTIMTADGSDERVSGVSNVGGIVGSNSGTLTNAYNTTAVGGSSSVGNAVGNNTGTVSNVYATNTDTGSKLIGASTGTVSNSYTFVSGDTAVLGVSVISDTTSKDSYDGFDFADTWLIYDGYGTPILKVFLTNATYDDDGGLIYNTDKQYANGSLTLDDGLTADSVAGGLLTQIGGKDAGDYMAYWSQQIASSGNGDTFDPNNLGYNISNNKFTIAKRQITVSLGDVERTYGDENITNGSYSWSYALGGSASGTQIRDMRAELDGSGGLSVSQSTDGAVDGVTGPKKTNDAGDYTWTADASLGENVSDNYEIVTVADGKSTVNKADLTISANHNETTYGTAFTGDSYTASGLVNGDSDSILNVGITNKGAADGTNGRVTQDAGTYDITLSQDELKNYNVTLVDGTATVNKADLTISADHNETTYGTAFTGDGFTTSGLTNGDGEDILNVTVTNNGAADGTGGKWTQNVGSYDITVNEVELGNYNVTYEKGTATVNKADLTITADDAMTVVGVAPTYSGTSIGELIDQLVNGDSLTDFSYSFGINDDTLINIAGLYPEAIGLILGGQFYGSGVYDLGSLNAIFANYNVTIETGDLTVAGYSIANYGHLYQDGWDRIRNFRERKAEINFIDGGMNFSKNQ